MTEVEDAWAVAIEHCLSIQDTLAVKDIEPAMVKWNQEQPVRLTRKSLVWVQDVADMYRLSWYECTKKGVKLSEYPVQLENMFEQGDYTLEDLVSMELPQPPSFLDSFMVKGSLTLVHAAAGVGKTPFAMMLCNAMLKQMGYIGWEAGTESAQRVLYLDGELPLWLLKQRALSIFDVQNLPKVQLFSAAAWYNNGNSGLDLSQQRVQDNLDEYIDSSKADVIVMDNRSNFFHGDENDNNEAHSLNRFLIKLREKGTSIIINHHQGKGGGFRGASAIIDPVDNVIGLDRDEEEEDIINIRFEKARFGWPTQSHVQVRAVAKGSFFYFSAT